MRLKLSLQRPSIRTEWPGCFGSGPVPSLKRVYICAFLDPNHPIGRRVADLTGFGVPRGSVPERTEWQRLPATQMHRDDPCT